MAGGRKITVEFLGNDRTLSRTANQVEGRMSRMGGTLKRVGSVAAVGFAVAGTAAIKFGSDAIGAASDLNETLNKSQVIFGKQAPAMEKWASAAAKSAGLSKQAALESAASFGDMFSQIGFAGNQAAKMSKQVVQLSADLGSFNNLDTAEVTNMIAAAFRGEYDSLQRVIPNINAARVETEALAMTHKKSAKELTAAEKAAATLAIVQKDGARAAGDFARTSDGLANQQKILSAQFENVKASIGRGLLPIATKAMQFFNREGVPALKQFGAQAQKVFNDIKVVVEQNMGEIRSTIASIVSIAQSLWARFGDTITNSTKAVWENVRSVIGGQLDIIAGTLKTFAAILRGDWSAAWNGVKQVLSGAWQVIRGHVSQGINFIRATFSVGMNALKGITVSVFGVIKNVVQGAVNKFNDLFEPIKKAATWIGGKLTNAVASFSGVMSRIGGALAAPFKTLWDWVKKVADKIQWILDKLPKVQNPFKSDGTKKFKGLQNGGGWDEVVNGDANGGRMSTGVPRLVGENGPELFVPDGNGSLTPHHQLVGSRAAAPSDFTVSAPLVIQMDSKNVWQGLLKMKRTNGIIELGLT